MKLGSETGSLVNHLYSHMTIGQPVPTIGMGATMLSYSDRHAATITEVTEIKSDKWSYQIVVTADNAKVVKGSTHDGSAEYEYETNPDGYTQTFRLDKKTNSWVQGSVDKETKRFRKLGGQGLIIGKRDEHRDPSF